MQTYMGIKLVVSEHIKPVPVLQIAHDFKWCTDAYREKHNAWLLERFGTYEPVYMLGSGTMAVSPKTMAQMRQEVILKMPVPNA